MKRHLLIMTLLLLGGIAGCSENSVYPPPGDPNMPPVNSRPFTTALPESYRESGVAQIGDTVYFIGGYQTGNGSSHVRAFDLKTLTFIDRAPMHYARREPGAVAMGGAIYVIGGYGESTDSLTGHDISRIVERYDPASNSWTELGTIKDINYDGLNPQGVASCAGRLYAISTRRSSHTFHLYESPDGVTWTTHATDIPACHEATLIGAEGRLYIIGRYDSVATPFMLEFDPAAGTFTPRTPPSVNKRGYANTCFYHKGRIFKLNTLGVTLAPMEIYTIATDTWTSLVTPAGLDDNNVYRALVTNTSDGEVYLTSLPDVRRGYYFRASSGTFYVKK